MIKPFFYRLFSDIGTWAEEIVILTSAIAEIPDNISAKLAGGIALPLLTAYEAIISLHPEKDQTILIHGAGGGVGYQAVQIAKRLGLNVIANASERDRDASMEAGVDQLINYKMQDFKVISIAVPDVNQMHKSGVKLPGFFHS